MDQLCKSRVWGGAFLSAGLAAAVIGCAGSGAGTPSGNNKVLSGNNQAVAVGVITAKVTAGGMAVPLAVLKSVSPTGVPSRLRPAALTPVPSMGLWMSAAVSGKTLTLKYFTDAQGKNPAGQITVSSTETIGSSYSYPVTFTASGQLTGGNIPLSIDASNPLVITFTDSKANTMMGRFDFTKDNVVFSLSLSLNDQGALGASDSISASYNYHYLGVPVPVSVKLTSLNATGSGNNPVTKVVGSAAISVQNPLTGSAVTGNGTGTLDLTAGTFGLSNVTGDLTGLLTLYKISTDSLNVSIGSGFHDVINNASTFNLGSLLTSTGATNGGTGGGGFQAPKAIQGTGSVTVEAALGDGEMVGFALDSSNQSTGYYWASPTAAPLTLDAPTNGSHTAAHGIASYSNQTVIVGSYTAQGGTVQPCFWIDTTGTHVFRAYAATSMLTYGGVFQGISANGNTIVGYSYDQAFNEQPIAYMSGSFYPLKTDGRSGNLRAVAADNANDILGAGNGSQPVPGVWKAVSVNMTTHTIDTPFTALGNDNLGGSPQALHMSDNGVVVGGDGFNAFYWRSADGFQTHLLPAGENFGVMGYGVNHAGTQFGGALFQSSPATNSDLAFWPSLTGAPVDVTAKLGSSVGTYKNLAGFFVLDDGSIIAIGTTSGSTSPQFVYIQNKG